MKRFIRYFIYRELYRLIRQSAQSSSSSGSTQPLDPDKPEDHLGQANRSDSIPIEDGPIETVGELQTILQQMDPYDFEHFIADLWERMGWSAEVSSASMDEGLDVIARKSSPYEQRVAIQAKRYGPNTTVGSPDIQQYASLLHQYDGIDKVLVVTTNEFTGQAQDLAGRLNVKLINGTELAELVGQYQALDLVAKYIDFVTAVETEPEEPVGSTEETAAPEPSTESARQPSGEIPETIWQKAIMIAIPWWLIAFFGVNILPESIWALLFFTVWFGLPIALYLDARTVREEVSWPKYTWAYVLTSFIWLLAIVPAGVYVWKRRARTATATAESETAKNGNTAESTAEATNEEQHKPVGNADETDPTETSSDVGGDDRMDVTYRGENYTCQTATAPNGAYRIAYKDGSRGHKEPTPGRVFLLDDDGELQFTTEIDRPSQCAVANDGTSAIVDWTLDWSADGSGVFHVFTVDGHQVLQEAFDANIGPCAITADGTYAAMSTLNPDCSTYLYDTNTGELLIRHENQHGTVQQIRFEDHGGTRMLCLGERDGKSAYGIDFAGEVVWKSEQLRDKERLNTLLERSEDVAIEERLSLLDEAKELTTEDWEKRRVANKLAEAHWHLAAEIKSDEGVTEAWWRHMEAACEQYRATLPWYEGKRGVAKTNRAMGTQYLKLDDRKAAKECFEAIEGLEAEYNVQLLTDQDKRQLEAVRSQM